MATVVTEGAFDYANPPAWTTFLASGRSTSLQLTQPGMSQTFYGTFTYSGTTSSPQVHGTVTEIDLTVNGVGGYQIGDLNLDAARLQQLVLTPNGGVQFLAYVLAGNDVFWDVGRGNVLGFTGNDTLKAADFSDGTFDGGGGIDTFVAAGVGVIANLATGRVVDASNPLAGYIQLRSVEILRGGDLDDTLIGNAGGNLLDGGAGIDTVSYASTGVAVQVNLSAGTGRGAGDDTLLGFENVIGGAGNDSLVGNTGANRFDGGAGKDTMRGGLGDDTYVLRQAGDVIVELAGGGRDTLVVGATWTLGAEFENLELSGNLAINGSGNALANRIVGNGAANRLAGGIGADTLQGGGGTDTLEGGAGADRLDGGLGDDRYLAADALDVITGDAGGTDTVLASVSYTLSAAAVENLTLTGAALNGTGNAWNNLIAGTSAANVLDGRAGADTLQGGAGNDTYVVDQASDRVTELADGGVDSVRSTVSWSLGVNLEQLVLTGSAALAGTGNGLSNRITGNAAANVLNGNAGADTLVGGLGNDTYVVDQAGDVLVEAASSGTDLVKSTTNWILDANLEDLLLLGTASLRGTGNALANHLDGNIGNNRLDGGAGADTLTGGLGSDAYVVDSAGDRIVEAWDEGIDVVYSSISWTLDRNVEQLRLTGTADIDGTGSRDNDRLVGNAGANRLDGGAGVDTLAGGAGDDTYYVDTVYDSVVETAGGGYDTIFTTGRFTLPDEVEKGVLLGRGYPGLIGNALNNVLVGAEFGDTLDGVAGADTLIGGEGADLYLFDDVGDRLIETGASGNDTLQSSVDVAALAAGIETVTLTGSAAINVKGNAAANLIEGNAGANRLDGGAGADTMIGGLGDDTYVVGNLGDVVEEWAASSFDMVWSSVSLNVDWARIEEIHLSGSADLDITSQSFGVTLVGNAGNNRFDGIGGGTIVSYANATGAVRVDMQAGTATGFGKDQLVNIYGVIGGGFNDTLRGSGSPLRMSNELTGGEGSDRFVLWSSDTYDNVLDFQMGADEFAVDQSDLNIGNGDLVIDAATDLLAAGEFGAHAELVVGFQSSGSVYDKYAAADAIGSASTDYALGQSAVFVVRASGGSTVYRFESAGTDALVSASELTLLAIASNAASVGANDFAWIA